MNKRFIGYVFDRRGVPLLAVLFAGLFLLESRYGLRKRVQGRLRRATTNFIVSLPAFALLRLLFIPAMVRLAVKNRRWRLGLTQHLPLPAPVRAALTFLLLDYSNYAWHILLHKLPLLWRFHLVHHTDLDLDITTAFRFHFGEMIGSVFFRGGAIVLTGASPLGVLVYEIAFEGATEFHHSNTRLPYRLEKALNYLVVTPRMHGIHHSMVRGETDSNYSTIFSFWDRLHRTVRLNVPQQAIVTGVPVYADPHELTIGRLLKLPFTRIRPWENTDRPLNNDTNTLAP
jgi:sterol desaturase/sphingolipid hydroxylase (fatty acid hydroxylase superfamily)